MGAVFRQLWCDSRHHVTGWTCHILPSTLARRCLLLQQWTAKTDKDQQVPLGAKESTSIHRCCNFCYLAFPLNWVFQGNFQLRVPADPPAVAQHKHRSAMPLSPRFPFLPRISRWKDLFVPFEGRGLTKANAKDKNKNSFV